MDDRGSHLNALFQNEWISTDTRHNIQLQHDRQRRTTKQLLDKARSALQTLIPSEEDTATLSNYVSVWLSILQELAPTTSLASSHEEMFASYSQMQEPNVDPFRLACWLLALAITSQLFQVDAYTPRSLAQTLQQRYNFAQAVQRTVENHIMSHDSIVGTVPGLETAMMFLRLNLTRGVLQKSWLGLRRIIAIAELIGLPRVSRLVQFRTTRDTPTVDQTMMAKAQLWESICTVERLAGTLMNFPIATRLYSISTKQPLVSNGKVHAATYWLMLSNIAIQIQDLDDLQASPGAESELYAKILRLDSELRILASATPKSWWLTKTSAKIDAGGLIQFQHYCITMRVHLPFAVRSDPSDQYAYSRLAGIEACEAVARFWCELRRLMPFGIFFSRPLDAQVFTAAVVLLLSSHSARSKAISAPDRTGRSDVNTTELLSQVMQLMEEKSKDAVGSDVAQQALTTLRSLSDLLEGDNGYLKYPDGLTVKVPLLGTIQIRRKSGNRANDRGFHTTTANAFPPSEVHSLHVAPLTQIPTGWESTTENPPTVQTTSTNDVANEIENDMFSWIINNDNEALFQENLMFEDYDLLNQWQPS
ncbi:hypothetical protein H2198_000859 [Neophaeococcomyces mojaviensis]|uniref:Uncharacterized protein n=1 Tax=Neophaeococcomyces mojaviensis TaxID=3383035 RepID=A0ACC3AIX1_9EURO|nr:hypothetical protein H2198_000859 [Knufia sp. JES_112]